MSDTSTITLGSLRGSASWAFTKFRAVPPLLTLPAIGLVAWFATPYAVKLAQGRSVGVTDPVDANGIGGTTTAPRSDPAAASVASLLTKPVTASMVPSWLPVPVPAPTPAPKPLPPRPAVQGSAPLTPRPKATARLVEPMLQQRQAGRSLISHAFAQHSPSTGALLGGRGTPQTGRSAAVGGGFQQRTNNFGARGTYGGQPFGGFRAPVISRPNFSGGTRGGGGFHVGGHR